jgi:hypothetical integral membrane protein (TIGR02206 family)
VETFAVFSLMHLAVVAIVVALTVLAIAFRRRRPPHPLPPGPVEKTVGYTFLAFWIGGFLYLRFGPLYEPQTTYPLQLCHWCSAAAALVLVTAHPMLRAFVYFCGLGLCTQAVITPFLPDGPARFPFWFFWLAHGMIVGVPIYDIAARGYRPGVRDYAFACAAAAFYVMFVLPIDLVTGWNYGFVGPSQPGVTSIVDFLGPWPQRLVWIVAMSAAAMFVLLLPWLWLARQGRPITVRTSINSGKKVRSSARLR